MFEKESEVNSDDLHTIQPFMGRLPEALAKLPEPLKNDEVRIGNDVVWSIIE